MPEDKPEPKPEPKPVESTPPSEVQGNEGKARRFVKYQDLSKEELVSMLLRVNKRLTRVNKELREIINILYYGNMQAPQEGGGQENQGYRKYSYRRNYSGNRQYGRYGNKYKRRSEDEDDVNYD
jgi:hypothetical protein